jgi:hypothetical protein
MSRRLGGTQDTWAPKGSLKEHGHSVTFEKGVDTTLPRPKGLSPSLSLLAPPTSEVTMETNPSQGDQEASLTF